MRKLFVLVLLISINLCNSQTDKEQREEILRLKKELAKQKSEEAKKKAERKKLGIIDCSDIIINTIELKGESTYSIPPKISDESITIKKIKNEKTEVVIISFVIMNIPFCSYREKGIYIKLSNDEILKFEDSAAKCSYMSNGAYIIIGSLIIDDNLYNKLKTYDILEFNLDNYNQKVKHKNPEGFKTLLTCLYEN